MLRYDAKLGGSECRFTEPGNACGRELQRGFRKEKQR